MKKKLTALALAGAMTLALLLSACGGTQTVSTDLTAGITDSGAEAVYADSSEVPTEDAAAMANFGLDLLKQCAGEENVLLSPASILSALGMTANGARGETLAQFETAFGLPIDELNATLSACLPAEDGPFSRANAIWFNDKAGLHIEDDFLQTNADWYDAGIYAAPFDDSTCRDINRWVSDHTRGMIPSILDKVPEDAIMYLVNALAFDGEWLSPYDANSTADGTFTREDGTTQTVPFMHSDEYAYLEGEKVTGFLKNYKDGSYAFAALLPHEGVSVAEALDSLDEETLTALLNNVSGEEVITAMPKFTVDYDAGLEDVLPALGVTDAFDEDLADFSGIGTSDLGNLYIGRVLHKTHMEVDELGTKAAAATVVEVMETAALELEPPKEVILDRPFIYMIVDRDSRLPLFLGTMMEITE